MNQHERSQDDTNADCEINRANNLVNASWISKWKDLKDEFNTANYIYSAKEKDDFGNYPDPLKRMKSEPAVLFKGSKDYRSLMTDAEPVIEECKNAALKWKIRKTEKNLSKRSLKSLSRLSVKEEKASLGLEKMQELKSAFKEKSLRLSTMKKDSQMSQTSNSTGRRLLPIAPKKSSLVSMDKKFAHRALFNQKAIKIQLSQFNPAKTASKTMYKNTQETSTSRLTERTPVKFNDGINSEYFTERRHTEA